MKELTVKTERLRLIVIQAIILIVLVFIFLSAVFILPYNRKIPTALILLSVLLAFPIWLEKKPPIVSVLFILTVFYAITWGKLITYPWYFHEYSYWSLLSIVIGFLMVRRPLSRWVIFSPLLIILLTVIIGLLFFSETASDGRFFKANRNILAMFVLIYAIMNSTIDVIQSRTYPSLIPPAVALVVCFYSYSRAGLLISVLYLLTTVGYLIIKTFQGKKGRNSFHFTVGKKILILVVASSLLVIAGLFVMNSRFLEVGLSSSGRITIYRSFFQEINFKNFLTGFRPSILDRFAHLHNSFLDLTAGAGIFAFFIFTLVIGGFFRLFKKNPFPSVLLLLIVLYAQVEHVIFLRLGDFALYPLLIYAYADFTLPKLKDKKDPS